MVLKGPIPPGGSGYRLEPLTVAPSRGALLAPSGQRPEVLPGGLQRSAPATLSQHGARDVQQGRGQETVVWKADKASGSCPGLLCTSCVARSPSPAFCRPG